MKDLEAVLRSQLPEATTFLRELVEINSHTRNAVGVEENAERIVRQFSSFGWQVRRSPCELPDTAGHLVLDSGGSGPAILLIAHLDTVYPAAEQEEGFFGWREDGGLVVGPGVYDIKGGTALIWLVLQALSILNEPVFRSVRWICAWNAAEESLPADFAAYCLSQCPEPVAALVFEGDNGKEGRMEVLQARSGLARFRVTSLGKGAHSGNGHESGINAIEGLARVVLEMASLTDYDRDTTVNVGVIRGGEATNRVPDFAEALVEVRFSDPVHFQEVHDRFQGLTHATPGTRCVLQVEMLGMIPPLVPSPENLALVNVWQEAARACQVSLSAGSRRGLSDANFFAGKVATLDGLGPSGGNAHGIERTSSGMRITEYLHLDTLLPKAAVNIVALRTLLGKMGGIGV